MSGRLGRERKTCECKVEKIAERANGQERRAKLRGDTRDGTDVGEGYEHKKQRWYGRCKGGTMVHENPAEHRNRITKKGKERVR